MKEIEKFDAITGATITSVAVQKAVLHGAWRVRAVLAARAGQADGDTAVGEGEAE